MEEVLQLIQGAMDQLAQAQELLAGGGQAPQGEAPAGPELQAILAEAQGGRQA